MLNWIYKHNTKWYLLGCTTLIIVGIVLIFTQYFGLVYLADDKALDMLFSYNQSTFFSILHALTESDRIAYKLIHLGDYLFIFGIYPLIAMGLSRSISQSHWAKYFIYFPLVAGIFDILENLMMDIHLYAYPHEFPLFALFSGVFSTSKFLFLYGSVLFLGCTKIYDLYRKLQKK